jgi:cytoskeleton protein RodZ
MLDEDQDRQSVGERLRAAREAQGLEIEEIASRTRIPTRHLQMIERGDYAALPAPTYSAGFIKTYARLLGLDGQALSDEFRDEIGSSGRSVVQTQSYEPADPRRTPPTGLALLALLVALVAGLGYLYWRGSSDQPSEIAAIATDVAPAPAASPIPAATAPAPTQQVAPVPSGGAVVITANQDVWIKVSDTGKTLFMGVLTSGNRFDVPADAAAPLLTTGRPGATAITVGGTVIPTVGDPKRAARDVSLKAADLLARMSPADSAAPGAPAAPVPNPAGPA